MMPKLRFNSRSLLNQLPCLRFNLIACLNPSNVHNRYHTGCLCSDSTLTAYLTSYQVTQTQIVLSKFISEAHGVFLSGSIRECLSETPGSYSLTLGHGSVSFRNSAGHCPITDINEHISSKLSKLR